MRVLGNTISRDIRESIECTLLELESLVQYATRRLNLPVRHEPPYHSRDVPQHDQQEMAILFPTMSALLRLFRYFTRETIRNMIYKEKHTEEGRGGKQVITRLKEALNWNR